MESSMKELFSLISIDTPNPISLDSSYALTYCNPIIFNEKARDGYIYVEACKFVPAAALKPYLYYSHNGSSWFLGTTLPEISTSSGKYVRYLADVPIYMRLAYTCTADFTGRIMLELNTGL